MAPVFSVGVRYLLFHCMPVFCITFLYKMCLERVVNIEFKEYQ